MSYNQVNFFLEPWHIPILTNQPPMSLAYPVLMVVFFWRTKSVEPIPFVAAVSQRFWKGCSEQACFFLKPLNFEIHFLKNQVTGLFWFSWFDFLLFKASKEPKSNPHGGQGIWPKVLGHPAKALRASTEKPIFGHCLTRHWPPGVF